jgi:lipopolysaccharide heptosyltransferase II
MRLGIILPNWIGDCVMATPALRALRQRVGTEGQLVGIMRPYVAEVFSGSRWFDQTIFYAKRSADRRHAWSAVQRNLRAARLDTILLMTNSLRTAWMAWRSGIGERIGYARECRGLMLTNRLRWPHKSNRQQPSQIDSYLNLAYEIGCERQSPRLELQTSATDRQQADAVWSKLHLPPGNRVVVLNTGGAYGAAKDWPAEYWAELAGRIASDHDLSVLVNCGPNERVTARAIQKQAANPHVASLADVDELPIGLTKECIRRCRLLVTTDSGPRFFAVAFERPLVTLFGPTSETITKTHYLQESCLSLGLDCQPCMRRTCPLGHHQCMRDLSVEQVYSAVASSLEGSRV